MTRIRTLAQAHSALKEMDAKTAVTPNALRRMVISGQIPYTKAGKKYLIDLDVLLEYLKGSKPAQAAQEITNSFKSSLKRLN